MIRFLVDAPDVNQKSILPRNNSSFHSFFDCDATELSCKLQELLKETTSSFEGVETTMSSFGIGSITLNIIMTKEGGLSILSSVKGSIGEHAGIQITLIPKYGENK